MCVGRKGGGAAGRRELVCGAGQQRRAPPVFSLDPRPHPPHPPPAALASSSSTDSSPDSEVLAAEDLLGSPLAGMPFSRGADEKLKTCGRIESPSKWALSASSSACGLLARLSAATACSSERMLPKACACAGSGPALSHAAWGGERGSLGQGAPCATCPPPPPLAQAAGRGSARAPGPRSRGRRAWPAARRLPSAR